MEETVNSVCHAVASPASPGRSATNSVRLVPMMPPHQAFDAATDCGVATQFLCRAVALCPEIVFPGIAADFCARASVLHGLMGRLTRLHREKQAVGLMDAVPFLKDSALARVQVLKADYKDIPGEGPCSPDLQEDW